MPSNSNGLRLASRKPAGYGTDRRGSSLIASVMTTPWVRLRDSTRVPLSSMRYSSVSARSSVEAHPGFAHPHRKSHYHLRRYE